MIVDPIPSEGENRDVVRNETDQLANQEVDKEVDLSRLGWQTGNFDANSGDAPTSGVLANLAFPPESAVRAEQASVARSQAAARVHDIDEPVYVKDQPAEALNEPHDPPKASVGREDTSDPSGADKSDEKAAQPLSDKLEDDKKRVEEEAKEKSVDDKSKDSDEADADKGKTADSKSDEKPVRGGDEQADKGDSDKELTPAQKAAATRKANAKKAEAAKSGDSK